MSDRVLQRGVGAAGFSCCMGRGHGHSRRRDAVSYMSMKRGDAFCRDAVVRMCYFMPVVSEGAAAQQVRGQFPAVPYL